MSEDKIDYDDDLDVTEEINPEDGEDTTAPDPADVPGDEVGGDADDESDVEEEDDADSGDGRRLDPRTQERVNKRIGKLTGRAKAAEERAAKLEAQLAELEAERLAAEDAKYANLPVDAFFIEASDRPILDKALESAERAQFNVDYWGRVDESGIVLEDGRQYTMAEAQEFARKFAQDLGRANGIIETITDRARAKQRAALRSVKGKTKEAAAAPVKDAKGAPEARKPAGDPPKSTVRRRDGSGGAAAWEKPKNMAEAKKAISWLDYD